MKKRKKKLMWYHAIEFGFAQIGDGLVTLFTLGKYNSELAVNTGVKIGKWRIKYKEKKWRK
jgi:hypothetical protein